MPDAKYQPTSADQLRAYLPNTQVITYPQLRSIKNIDDLLGPEERAVILYEFKKGYGHWTCVFRRSPDVIECFDSYGPMIGLPDDELKLIPKKFREQSGQTKKMLLQLLADDGCQIDYNNYKLQSWDPRVCTCGRWCVARLAFADKSIDQFAKMFKGLDGDDIVSAVIK